jgi:sugar-specific transcriptional regulator TrmB
MLCHSSLVHCLTINVFTPIILFLYIFVNSINIIYIITDVKFVILKMTKICYIVCMEEILHQIGLSDKESTLYLLLLAEPHQTAQELGFRASITRTNVYRLLEKLQAQQLIAASNDAVKHFSVTEPQNLQKLLQQKQQEIKQASSSLSAVMPQFRAQYSLSLDKPGVVYLPGEDGLERLLQDMAHSKTEVLLIAGDEPKNKEVLRRFRELIMIRKENGIHTRALFHDGSHRDRITDKFAARGFSVRFAGTTPFDSEVIVYEDNVVFSVYNPSLITTIITNKAFASTMRTVFEQLWENAK